MISIKRFIVDTDGTILVDVNLLVGNQIGGAHLQQISLELPFQVGGGDGSLGGAVRNLVGQLEREVKGVLQTALADA